MTLNSRKYHYRALQYDDPNSISSSIQRIALIWVLPARRAGPLRDSLLVILRRKEIRLIAPAFQIATCKLL